MKRRLALVSLLILSLFLPEWLPFLSPSPNRNNNLIKPVRAFSDTIRPNGDTTKQWASTATDHWTEVSEIITQPDAGTTSNYLDNVKVVGNTDQLQMETVAGATDVSAITIWVYGYCSKKTSVMSIDLYYDGAVQNSGSVTFGTSYDWQSAVFSGLNLTTDQLSALEIAIYGDSGGRTYYVATLYADVTYSAISISLATDGNISFGLTSLNTTKDTTATGINDPEVISVDQGPVNLDVRSTAFSDGSNTWTLNTNNGDNQVLWESSKDGSAWTTFAIADTLYTLDTNVDQGSTRNLYLRLTTPTASSSYSQHSTTITVVASAP